MSITVAISVVVHGLSAPPLISRYAAHAQARPKADSLLQEVEVPTARKALGSLAERGRGVA